MQPGVSTAPQFWPGHHHLVVGVERVGLLEDPGVVVEAGLGHATQVGRVALERSGQGGPRVPPEVQAGVLPGDRHPGPAADDEHRRRDRRGGRELPTSVTRRSDGASVGQHRPVRGRGHPERDGRLQVVLVEAREDPVREVHADVRRRVDLAVGRVGEGVHALAVRHVGQPGLDHHLVGGPQVAQRDPAVGVLRLAAVDAHLVRGVELQERRRAGLRTRERDPGADPEGLPVGQVERDVVGHVREQGGPGAGLVQGEGHRPHATRIRLQPGGRPRLLRLPRRGSSTP